MRFNEVMNMFKNGKITNQSNFNQLTEEWTSVEHEDFWNELTAGNSALLSGEGLFAEVLVRYLDKSGLIDYADIAERFFAQTTMDVRDFTIKSICENAGKWLNEAPNKDAENLKNEWNERAARWYWPHVLEHCVATLNYYNGYACKVALAKQS